MCLHAVDKYENVENVNTQNDYETASKRWIDKTKTDLFFMSCKCVKIPKNKFKIVQKNDFLEKPPVAMIITW